ncbi:MAG TPA: hypothetical protein PLG94_17970 [Smithellaceae bacterium]|nr:hypothetical protein [Smithellaceae bacterium]
MSDEIPVRSRFRNYTIHFTNDFRRPLQAFAERNCFFVIDSNVYERYGKGFDAVSDDRLVTIEANEFNKSLEKCRDVVIALIAKNFRRDEMLVAIGGGIIQDITAFSASILYRGVEWSFVPTTLLAQCDSCIGSKTSVNLEGKKNLIGNFYPPSDIHIDTTFLSSLSTDDIKSGIGEMMHYYLYAGESALLEEVKKDFEDILINRNLFKKHIVKSLEIKKSVVEIDELDKGERNKFNYGHTFGHAIESITGYAIKHGQAVTVGMDLANYVSMEQGLMSQETFHRIHDQLSFNFPEYAWSELNVDRYIQLLLNDKKNFETNVGCILATQPGELFKRQIPVDSRFRKVILDYFNSELPKNNLSS